MFLLNAVDRVREQLRHVPGVEIQHDQKLPPASTHEISALERELKQQLPRSLRRVLSEEAGGLLFGWVTEGNLFGPECRYGGIHLLSPEEAVEVARELRQYAAEVQQDPILVARAGFAAMIEDWPFWIPVCRFMSADCFCLDIRRGGDDYPVVFLEHDVMGGGPNVHGLQLAPNFEDLVLRWSELAFVELHDWTPAISDTGIDVGSALFRQLRYSLNT